MFAIQAKRNNSFYFVTENERLTTDINKALIFDFEVDAINHLNWEGPFGLEHKTLKLNVDRSYLKNKYSNCEFTIVDTSIRFPRISQRQIQNWMKNHDWFEFNGRHFSGCGQHIVRYV